MKVEASKNEGDGSDPAPIRDGLVLCTGSAEARMLRRAGYRCITAAKFRRELGDILGMKPEDAGAHIEEAFSHIGGISEAVNAEHWKLWRHYKANRALIERLQKSLPSIPTPFQDPSKCRILSKGELWPCEGTTVIVARDTFELVRAAQSYHAFDCYRPRGRMDEPFSPQPGRVCLITLDEVSLLRLSGTEVTPLVLAFSVDRADVGEGQSRWPSEIRAVCGEWPDTPVVVAPTIAPASYAEPFFLGLKRDYAFEAPASVDTNAGGAVDFMIHTDTEPEADMGMVVRWAGNSDVHRLVRFGGLSIFTGNHKRRKVQLRSLRLIRSGSLAGAPVYDMYDNRHILTAWARDDKFARLRKSDKRRMRQRVRGVKCPPKCSRGTYIIHKNPPGALQGTKSTERNHASKLRNLPVLAANEAGVTTVPLKTLGSGGGVAYRLNCRATVGKDGKPDASPTRCKIRCPVWMPGDAQVIPLLNWLAESPNVIMSGLTSEHHVFAVVRVCNGTQDQQEAAIRGFSEEVGEFFRQDSGAPSWIPASVRPDAAVRPATGVRIHTNFHAVGLETGGFERYRIETEPSDPPKSVRRATAGASERASAYVDSVPDYRTQGTRHTTLAGVMLNIRDQFGNDALAQVAPKLLSKSDLPEKEKRKILSGIIGKPSKRGKEGTK